MRRSASSPFILATALAVLQSVGCGTDREDAAHQSTHAQRELAACGMDDVAKDKSAKLHACAPDDAKKTTICHVPPGNPANAHTICIGNSAVKHHLQNHDDYLGPCKVETPCPPPAPETPAPETPAPETPPPSAGGMSGGSSGSGGSAGGYVIPPPG